MIGSVRPDATSKHRAFYEADDPQRWGRPEMPQAAGETLRWIEAAGLQANARCLELGSGAGALAELVPQMWGLEISWRALRNMRSTRGICGDMQACPVRSEGLEFVFSWAAIEHVPVPELVLAEVERILKPGGVALLAPAWNVRPWAASGIEVTPWRSLGLRQRLTRILLPVRNALAFRALVALPGRIRREALLASGRKVSLEYRRLEPNLAEYVQTDSDAFSSIDPHAAIAYFASRKWDVLSHPDWRARMLSRHEPVVARKPRTL
ncbi:MAG TPA: class I SAM-dependent methyltransferase [Thermoanaerobaculia bacterium]|nr:class I SAM-dependent methyltransferase [Thermoanaerobaculia bacterium]